MHDLEPQSELAAGSWVPPGFRCPQCSYDLTGLTEWRCPECGSPFTLEELRSRLPAGYRRTTRLLFGITGVLWTLSASMLAASFVTTPLLLSPPYVTYRHRLAWLAESRLFPWALGAGLFAVIVAGAVLRRVRTECLAARAGAWFVYMTCGLGLACALTSLVFRAHGIDSGKALMCGGMLELAVFLIPYSWYVSARAWTHPLLDAAVVPIVFNLLKALTNDRWLRDITNSEHWLGWGVPMWLLAIAAGALCSALRVHRGFGYLLVMLLVLAVMPDLVS